MEQFAYVSFDRIPSPKGAAVHIKEFVRALGREFGAVDLVTPSSEAREVELITSRWPGVDHYQLPAVGGDLIRRVMSFRSALSRYVTERRQIVHFRSIFEGYPLAVNKDHVADYLIFEVNGMPSIELKYHHPDVADDRELLTKLRHQEDVCLAAADRIVTPSAVTAAYLVERGADVKKIAVIPNGVDPKLFSCTQPERWSMTMPRAPLRMLYAGTLSVWQGLRYALDALSLYNRDAPAELTIIGPTRGRQRSQLEAWCRQDGLEGRVKLIPPMSQLELAHAHHDHDVVVAPLLANDRNTIQGCCPLKILEAMASGVPLIASDLPVVRDLARGGQEALLVRPGSGKAIKDAMFRLDREPGLAIRLAAAARKRVEKHFTWKQSCEQLVAVYRDALAEISSRSLRNSDTSAAG
jgi:glycosyltransferase involved in cell wall biosynthesis